MHPSVLQLWPLTRAAIGKIEWNLTTIYLFEIFYVNRRHLIVAYSRLCWTTFFIRRWGLSLASPKKKRVFRWRKSEMRDERDNYTFHPKPIQAQPGERTLAAAEAVAQQSHPIDDPRRSEKVGASNTSTQEQQSFLGQRWKFESEIFLQQLCDASEKCISRCTENNWAGQKTGPDN